MTPENGAIKRVSSIKQAREIFPLNCLLNKNQEPYPWPHYHNMLFLFYKKHIFHFVLCKPQKRLNILINTCDICLYE